MKNSSDPKKVKFTGEDWSSIDFKGRPHIKAKTHAEMAAWKFHSNLPIDEKYDFTTIIPGLVLGSNLNHYNLSTNLIKNLITGQMKGIPPVQLPFVDIRDVAAAHLQAILVPEAANRRFLVVGQMMWLLEVGEQLHIKYGKNYNVTHKKLSKMMMAMGSLVSGKNKEIIENWSQEQQFECSPAQEVLKILFKDTKEALMQTAESLIETGLIEDKRDK